MSTKQNDIINEDKMENELLCENCGKRISWFAFRASTSSVYKKAMCNICWDKERVSNLQNRIGETAKVEADPNLEVSK